ncbi:hypothetical protein [Maricaulis sp.]|uniref:hypothetical protein n=1 Tax=Maricaulis sp. TaxID=1486257 RepID=UPI003A927BF0
MMRPRSILLPLLCALTLSGFSPASADDRVKIELTIPDTATPAAPWAYQVRYTIPALGMASLDVRDMSRRTPDCPGVAYEIVSVANADLSPLDLQRDGRIGLVPRSADPVEITYRVSAVLAPGEVTINNVLACNVIITDGGNAFIDGQAVFLAPRPLDEQGAPFRFGATELRLVGLPDGAPAILPGAAEVSPGVWQVDHFDELRFSYLATGGWSGRPNRADGSEAVTYSWSLGRDGAEDEAVPLAVSDLAGRMLDHLETAWGEVGITDYAVLLIETSGRHGDFANLTGTARQDAQVMFYSPGAELRLPLLGVAHEIAHLWAPGRLGVPDPDATSNWIGEGLADFTAYRVLIALGALEPGALQDRANIALQNRQLGHTPELEVYDYGFLAWLYLAAQTDGDPLAPAIDDFVRELMRGNAAPISAARFWSTASHLGLFRGEMGAPALEQRLPCRLSLGEAEYALVEGVWPQYGIGWTLSDELAGVIAEVEADGPAARAGFQAGDRILTLQTGGFGNIHRPVRIEFISGGEHQIRSILPRREMGAQSYLQYVADIPATRLWADIAPPVRCQPLANQAVR